jgi:type III pantothenate kinase
MQCAMLVAVDIGNTSIKLGCFAEAATGFPRARQVMSISTHDRATWSALSHLPDENATWLVGSVHRGAEAELAAWVQSERPNDTYRKLTNAELPIAIEVEAPERVGIDRLLAAVAVNELRDAARPAIVIDAGSAITVDLVSAAGAFRGGVIWPGWRLMSETLRGQTDALPLVAARLDEPPPAIVGTSTEKAIRSGLYWGNVGAVREFVARMRAELPAEPQIFVTGGDAARLAAHACPDATRVEELVLAGLVLAHAARR